MLAGEIVGILETKAACLPGSRDLDGRPLIIIYVPPELQPWTKDNLEVTLRYFSSIFGQETRSRGFTVVVDGQKNAWRVARACIRHVSLSLGSDLASLIVLRPDAFWDKQRVDNCTKIRKEEEVSSSWPGFVLIDALRLTMRFSFSRFLFRSQDSASTLIVHNWRRNSVVLGLTTTTNGFRIEWWVFCMLVPRTLQRS